MHDRLGSVIGYLISGAFIGTHGLGLSENPHEGASQLAKFGGTLMLLLTGLELNPRLLWKLHGPIFRLGSLPLLSAIAAFAGLTPFLTGAEWPSALAVAMIVSVSSTRPSPCIL